MRLDQHLVTEGLAKSRARARTLIEAGYVLVDGRAVTKCSFTLPDGAVVTLTAADDVYVSRAAHKLLELLNETNLSVADTTVLDLGASTGGFTQVCLEKGAQKVYAVDVGTGQLDADLAEQENVLNMERTDGRNLTADMFTAAPPTVLVSDVSFISLTKVLPAVFAACQQLEQLGLLVKPQFELQPADIGKGGLVKDPAKHQQACESVQRCVEAHGFTVQRMLESPIKGSDGNIEFLLYATRQGY